MLEEWIRRSVEWPWSALFPRHCPRRWASGQKPLQQIPALIEQFGEAQSSLILAKDQPPIWRFSSSTFKCSRSSFCEDSPLAQILTSINTHAHSNQTWSTAISSSFWWITRLPRRWMKNKSNQIMCDTWLEQALTGEYDYLAPFKWERIAVDRSLKLWEDVTVDEITSLPQPSACVWLQLASRLARLGRMRGQWFEDCSNMTHVLLFGKMRGRQHGMNAPKTSLCFLRFSARQEPLISNNLALWVHRNTRAVQHD